MRAPKRIGHDGVRQQYNGASTADATEPSGKVLPASGRSLLQLEHGVTPTTGDVDRHRIVTAQLERDTGRLR